MTRYNITIEADSKTLTVGVENTSDDHECVGKGCCVAEADREAQLVDALTTKLVKWANFHL